MSRPFEPRRFGGYLLTAELREDALGRVYRAVRLAPERGFFRVRVFDSPEISADAVLDAIQANGEIHTFLKNPAIARDVQMDAVGGIPFLAWREPNGRTLDAVLGRAREMRQPIPFEHALLIAEKLAAALDHAYNTTMDGERTLHGLVWPGFVSISDDGEVRLAGFGLAAGFIPSFSMPRFQEDVGPYLAPEERDAHALGATVDVYSVGALLLEMLAGEAPHPADPLAPLRAPGGPPLVPELVTLLKSCVGKPAERYQSAGELRRDLGKLLFSGPYSPSTFNFAFYLNTLFAAEIEAENAARAAESGLDEKSFGEEASPAVTIVPASPPAVPAAAEGAIHRNTSGRVIWGSALLVTAAVGGTLFVVAGRPTPRAGPAASPTRVAQAAIPTPMPVYSTPVAETSAMTESQFKNEVSRRVTQELKKLQDEMAKARAPETTPLVQQASRVRPRDAAPPPIPTSAPTARAELAGPPPTAPPQTAAEPTRIVALAATDRAAPAKSEEEPPKIQRIVKPIYPAMALKARIGGIVVLRVLVSESGSPVEVEVLKEAGGGLTGAAVSAVRRWSFEPARRGGVPVAAWTTIPIPFQP